MEKVVISCQGDHNYRCITSKSFNVMNEVLLSISDENDDPSTACLHAQDTREKENKVMFDGPCKTFSSLLLVYGIYSYHVLISLAQEPLLTSP